MSSVREDRLLSFSGRGFEELKPEYSRTVTLAA